MTTTQDDVETSASLPPVTMLGVHMQDALALLELVDLTDDMTGVEAAAVERLRGLIVGAQLNSPCSGCGARVGDLHHDYCDVAVCRATGNQRLICSGHDGCGQDVWTGVWPGQDDARAAGLFAYHDGGRIVECDPMHPEARPDLNRLHVECRWDRASGHWLPEHAAELASTVDAVT